MKRMRRMKNEKEGEEVVKSTSPRSYPSPSHKLLANYLTDVCYRTFFNNADIVEENEVIKIKPENDFSRGAIEKYVPTLEIQTHKNRGDLSES